MASEFFFHSVVFSGVCFVTHHDNYSARIFYSLFSVMAYENNKFLTISLSQDESLEAVKSEKAHK